jgi:hypothetical protein
MEAERYMNELIKTWYTPIEWGILAVTATWAIRRDLKTLRERWKGVRRRK